MAAAETPPLLQSTVTPARGVSGTEQLLQGGREMPSLPAALRTQAHWPNVHRINVCRRELFRPKAVGKLPSDPPTDGHRVACRTGPGANSPGDR